MYKFLFVVFVAFSADAAKLPNYLQPCSKTDPNIGDCAKKAAVIALPEVLKGDKRFKNPDLNPLFIDEVVLNVGDNLKMKFNNVTVTGIETTQVTGFGIDVEKKHWILRASMDYLTFIITYDISGRILILPITGRGPGNLTLEKPNFDFSFDYEVVNRKENDYMQIKDSTLSYKAQRVYYQLDNLFNGDQRLGPEMNRFLNENWEDVNKEIGPSIEGTMNNIVANIFSNYFKRIPYNQLISE